MRDIYHDTDHRQFNNIYCKYHPEVVIIDHYSSYIEVSTSNYIVFVILNENIKYLTIDEFILAVFIKKIPSFTHISEYQMYPSLFDIE